MILWFGNKKKQELEEAGRQIEAEQAVTEAAEQADPVEAAPASAPAGAGDTEVQDVAPIPDVEGNEDEAPEQPTFESSQDQAPEPAVPAGAEAGVAPETAPPELTKPNDETTTPGFFSKLATGLKRSSSKLSDGITGVFTKDKLNAATLEELEDLLIASDLGTSAAAKVTERIGKNRFDMQISDTELKAVLAEEIAGIMAPREQIVDFADGPSPRVVLFVGVNGSGKTTTIGKIASRLKEQGAKAMLVAGDTFRAAAIEQLTVWGERAGIPVISKEPGADAAGLVYEAVERAKAENYDLVLVDTAGRLQNKTELMGELAKVVRVVRKLDPNAPHDVILVLDATVGQNALSQVEAFRQTADVTGLVMTKLDGTAKGGVLVAIADAHALPIHFVGVGERAEDLQPFSAEAYARALVGLEA